MDKPLKIFTVIIITVVLFPVLTQAEYFVRKFIGPIILPSFFLLCVIFIPILWKEYLKDGWNELAEIYRNTMLIIFPFLLVALISVSWGLHPGVPPEASLKLITRDFYHWILLLLSIAIGQSWTVKKYHRIIFLMVLIGASIAVWVDYFVPGTFSRLSHRAAGLGANANDGSRIILLLCIAAIDWKKNGWVNLVTLAASGMTVFVTLSVGNLLLYLTVVGYYLYLSLRGGEGEHFIKKISLVAAVPLLIILVIQPMLVDMKDSSAAFDNRTSQDRLDKILNFFQGDTAFVDDHSRKDLANEYWESIFESPILGHGTGFSARQGTKGAHNMYLKHWVENGLFGFLIYLSLMAGTCWFFFRLRDKRGMIFSLIFFLSGFHSHNILRDKTTIVLLGIFATLAYLEKSKKAPSLTPGKTTALQ
jgi:O-antigen ligase